MTYDDDPKLNSSPELESPLDSLEVPEEEPTPDPEEMLALLESPDLQQRILATRAFCELKEDRAIPRLIQLLTDACPMTRVSAAYALGRNTSPAAVEPLIAQLEDWNGYVRKGVVWALGNYGDRRSLEPLIEALQTDIAAVRLWAASALGQLYDLDYDLVVKAIPALLEGLQQDTMDVVRGNCAWALGQICRELPLNEVYSNIIETLLQVLVLEPDLGVREDAKEALLKVGDPAALQRIEELEQEGVFW
jgi:HEAT repeat protein